MVHAVRARSASPSRHRNASGAIFAKDCDRAHIGTGKPTQVVSQPEHWLFCHLPVASSTIQLQVDLIQHPEAGSPNRMSKAFETAVDLTRHPAMDVVEA